MPNSNNAMKKSQLILMLAFFVITSVANAQTVEFKVLATKGANEVKSGDAWLPLKTGTALKTNDEVRLGANSYLGLVSSTGKPMELKEANVYLVSDLKAKMKSGNTSSLNRFTDFILSSNSAEAKKNRLNATGAVHRGGEVMPINLHLPESQHAEILGNEALVAWSGTAPGPYIVTFRDMYDDELLKVETEETSLRLNLKDTKLAKESAIFVEIKSKNDPKLGSKKHLIKRAPLAKQQSVQNDLSGFINELSEQTALNKLIMAGFYEENDLLIDAMVSYEEAIRLAPDVPTYKEVYEEFQLRHGLRR